MLDQMSERRNFTLELLALVHYHHGRSRLGAALLRWCSGRRCLSNWPKPLFAVICACAKKMRTGMTPAAEATARQPFHETPPGRRWFSTRQTTSWYAAARFTRLGILPCSACREGPRERGAPRARRPARQRAAGDQRQAPRRARGQSVGAD